MQCEFHCIPHCSANCTWHHLVASICIASLFPLPAGHPALLHTPQPTAVQPLVWQRMRTRELAGDGLWPGPKVQGTGSQLRLLDSGLGILAGSPAMPSIWVMKCLLPYSRLYGPDVLLSVPLPGSAPSLLACCVIKQLRRWPLCTGCKAL
ncbi:hypothetical protein AAFF_G00018820 [Aldrovandia affinis]|uniref:Uncharacterized protein n=1 Tax=Aldrovandia affinis TaxID=143900 RepID=A0AAD7S5I1_9TELE|nr:hypothetical protein AAFF_G00018820 [Aldrovandia affinis]